MSSAHTPLFLLIGLLLTLGASGFTPAGDSFYFRAVDDIMDDFCPRSGREIYLAHLRKGNVPLSEAYEARNTLVLWTVFLLTDGGGSPEDMRMHQQAGKYLAQIPRHTQRHIDIVEQKILQEEGVYLEGGNSASWIPKERLLTDPRLEVWQQQVQAASTCLARQFAQIASLASVEAVQTLMTYVDDNRGADVPLEFNGTPPGPITWKRNPPVGFHAMNALRSIFGDQAPDHDLPDISFESADLATRRGRYHEWWQSAASQPWRKSIVPTSRGLLLTGGLAMSGDTRHESNYFATELMAWIDWQTGGSVLIVGGIIACFAWLTGMATTGRPRSRR